MKKKKHKAGSTVNIAILNRMNAADLEDFFGFLMDALSKLREDEAAEDDCSAEDADSAGDERPAADEYIFINKKNAAEDAADTAETSGTNGNGEKYVAVIFPGEDPRFEKYGNCDSLLDRFGDHIAVWQIPEEKSLCVIYDRRRVLDLGGEKYLLGPVIVYRGDESFNALCGMESDDYPKICRTLGDRTVTLQADQHEFRAIRM